MTNLANETFGQARQGSIAAIIQVLNERLADMGIRTRAVIADGMLQLLCEASTPEQLEKSTVVERVRQELEAISPHRVKRVKINSRIVKEEQLLWLAEINRDPQKALLWAEVITLKRPFFVQRWIRDRDLKPGGPLFTDITQPAPNRSSLSSKLVAGIGLSLLIVGIGWLFREDLSQIQEVAENNNPDALPADAALTDQTDRGAASDPNLDRNPEAIAGDRTADTTPSTAIAPIPSPSAASNSRTDTVADAFSESVRIAEQAAIEGQTASTAAEWLDLAARWQRASDLMIAVPPSSAQSSTAQDRAKSYRVNSESALNQATAAQKP